MWHIKIGDKVQIKTFTKTKEYTVYNIYITEPDDVNIVKQTDETKLTLVTCYPFTYSWSAKQRCVVECK